MPIHPKRRALTALRLAWLRPSWVEGTSSVKRSVQNCGIAWDDNGLNTFKHQVSVYVRWCQCVGPGPGWGHRCWFVPFGSIWEILNITTTPKWLWVLVPFWLGDVETGHISTLFNLSDAEFAVGCCPSSTFETPQILLATSTITKPTTSLEHVSTHWIFLCFLGSQLFHASCEWEDFLMAAD